VLGQIRHRDAGAPALARQTGPDAFEAVFETPRTAVAPGQAAVLYDGDDVLAGGWIATTGAGGAPEADPDFLALPTL
jgi:tRNA-specific 2-thiouridylase